MAQQTIDFEGAFIKSIKDSINDNFTELYEYASSSLSNLIHTFDITQDADNASALNTLIASVSANGGGVILISEGNMNNSRIVPKSGVFLIGSGWKTTFKTSINRVAVYQDVSTEDLENFSLFFDVNWPNKKEHITIFSSDIYPTSNIFSVQWK